MATMDERTAKESRTLDSSDQRIEDEIPLWQTTDMKVIDCQTTHFASVLLRASQCALTYVDMVGIRGSIVSIAHQDP